MAGFQVGGACYESEVAAAQVAASAELGRVVQHGGNAYVVDAAAVAAGVINYTFLPVGGGAAVATAAPYTAQPCHLMDYADGLSMAWMVVAAWASAYGVMFLRKALVGETGGDYGNA